MKITLEDQNSEQLEIIIRGNLSDERVQTIITLLKENALNTKLIVFDAQKEIILSIKDILYFEVTQRKTYVYTSKHEYTTKYTLSQIQTIFKQQGVCQIGKSILVNIHHVQSLEAEFSGNYIVTLDNHTKLMVSRFYMKHFRKVIMEG